MLILYGDVMYANPHLVSLIELSCDTKMLVLGNIDCVNSATASPICCRSFIKDSAIQFVSLVCQWFVVSSLKI